MIHGTLYLYIWIAGVDSVLENLKLKIMSAYTG